MCAMNAETWAEIRRLKGIENLSISEIARRLRLDRKTVRRAVRSQGVPKRKVMPRRSKLDDFKGYIQGRLEEFPRITSVRLLRELGELGFEGGVSRLKEFVATIRVKPPEAFFRIETLPGEEAQVDWANCGTIRVGNATRKLSAFVMVMSYSRMLYAEFTLSQCLEDFLQAHVRAFRFFGGIPLKLLYDNLKAVCLTRLGSEIRFNERFLEFSGHYLFTPVLCQPGHGNEKGKVERGIQYLRSSFLDGRQITDWARANDELRKWLSEVANVRAHAVTRRRPVDRFEEEKAKLRPVIELALDLSIIRAVKTTSQALVHFDGNLHGAVRIRFQGFDAEGHDPRGHGVRPGPAGRQARPELRPRPAYREPSSLRRALGCQEGGRDSQAHRPFPGPGRRFRAGPGGPPKPPQGAARRRGQRLPASGKDHGPGRALWPHRGPRRGPQGAGPRPCRRQLHPEHHRAEPRRPGRGGPCPARHTGPPRVGAYRRQRAGLGRL